MRKERKMKRFTNLKCVSILLMVACVLLITAFVGCSKKSEPNEIKIGAIMPLTGDAGIYGQEMKKGIDLCIELANESGGIKGTTISVVYEDDGGQANLAVNAFQKLIFQDKLDVVIGGAMSSTAMSVAPLAEKNKVVFISPAASTPALTNAGDFIFRVWPSDAFEGSAIAKFSYNNVHLRVVSIVYVNNDYGKGASEVFKKEFENAGGSVAISEGYEFGNTDFRPILTKIKQTNSEGIYVPGYQKELVNILNQSKEMGLKIRFLGGVGFNDPEILKLTGDTAENTIFASPYYDPQSSDPVTHKFVTGFKAKYGKEPAIFAAHSYDAAGVLIEAIKIGGPKATDILYVFSKNETNLPLN